MPVLFRGGFWRDFLVLLTVTVLLGSAVAYGTGWAVDAFFGDTVRSLIGDAGDYDMLLQVRGQRGDVAQSDLQRIVDEHLPGAHLDEGVALGGNRHFFLKLPTELRTAATFEGIDALFEPVPGYLGVTFMVEPSLVVSGVHPAVVGQVAAEAERLAGVAFTFRHAGNVIVALQEAEAASHVFRHLEAHLAEQEIVEIRLPPSVSLPDPAGAASDVASALQKVWGEEVVEAVSIDPSSDDTEAFVATLHEIRRFLLGYATQVVVAEGAPHVGRRVAVYAMDDPNAPPLAVQLEGVTDDGVSAWGYLIEGEPPAAPGHYVAYEWTPDESFGTHLGAVTFRNERSELLATLAESTRLLQGLADFADEASAGVGGAEAVLLDFEQAVARLGELHAQIEHLQRALAGTGGDGPAEPGQAILSVLLTSWLSRQGGAEAPATEVVGDRLLGLDVGGIRQTLQVLAGRVGELHALDVDAVLAQIGQLERTLPLLDDAEIARSIRLIDTNLGGRTISGDRITLVAQAGVAVADAEQAALEVLGVPGLQVYRTGLGVVAPNARTALTDLLGQVRSLVAAIVSLVIVLFTLLLDHSTLLSALRTFGSSGPKALREAYALGAASGAALLLLVTLLSGGRFPLLGSFGVLLLGGALGWAVAALAPRISPVDRSEVVAGEALGLDSGQILREIVIPVARPGLLNVLNRRQQILP